MAQAISLEMGAPIDFSTQLQAGTGASHIKSYIKVLKEYTFEANIRRIMLLIIIFYMSQKVFVH